MAAPTAKQRAAVKIAGLGVNPALAGVYQSSGDPELTARLRSSASSFKGARADFAKFYARELAQVSPHEQAVVLDQVGDRSYNPRVDPANPLSTTPVGDVPTTVERHNLTAQVASGAKTIPQASSAFDRFNAQHDRKATSNIVDRFAAGAIHAATGAPAAAATLSTAAYHDVGAVVHGHEPTHVYREVLTPLAKSYAHKYGPLFHGHPGETLHRMGQDPFGSALDAYFGAGAAAKALDVPAKLGSASAALREGEGIAAAKQAFKEATLVPRERTLSVPGTNGTVQPWASPNNLTRAFQHAYDRASEAVPNAPGVGAVARVSRRIPFEAERNFERNASAAIPFQLAERKLRGPLSTPHPQQTAYDVLHSYGHDPAQALSILDSEIAQRERIISDPQTPVIQRANQWATVKQLKLARDYVANPSPKMQDALAKGGALSDLGEQVRIDLGQLDPEAAAAHVEQRARLATGGQVVEARLSRSVKQARLDVERIQRSYDRAAAARDVNAARELERARGRAAAVERPVPHTLETAKARVAQLEQQHEKFMRRVEQQRMSEPIAPEAAKARIAEIDQQIVGHEQRRGEAQTTLDELAAARRGGATHEQLSAEYGAAPNLSQHGRAVGHVYGGKHKAARAEAERALRALRAERGRYEEALKTGRLRHTHDRAETATRNLLRRSAKGTPTLREEMRAAVEHEIEQLVARNPEHPTVKAYASGLAELRQLREGIGKIQERQLGGEPTADLERTLGHRHGPSKESLRARELTDALGHADPLEREAIHEELRRMGRAQPQLIEPGRIVTHDGRLLHVTGSARVSRLGGALSVARDRLAQVEQRHLDRYGIEAGKGDVVEVVGGRPPGPGARYVSDKPRRNVAVATRARNVTGKRAKQSYERRSRGILFSQGRARRSSRVVLEDFVQTARSLTRKQDVEKAATFATPLREERGGLPDRGYVYFNPEGVKVPHAFNEEHPEMQVEQMLPRELATLARRKYETMLHRTFVERGGETFSGDAFQKALREGRIQQIPKKIADAFNGGAYTSKLSNDVTQTLLDVLDLSNNVTRLGVLYLKLSFVPTNFAGNLAFLAIQQGVWAPVNLAKAAGILGDLSPETLRLIDHEVGSGAAVSVGGHAVGPLGAVTRKTAHLSNVGADLLPRRAAWIHEAAQRGYKTEADVRRLLTEARLRRRLNQVSETSEKAMVQFRGLSRFQQRILTRAVFIWPWVRGATKYAGRLPLDRPGRASLLATLGQQGYDDTHKRLGDLVSYLDGLIPVGAAERKLGTTLVPVRNPAALTPLGTGVQSLHTLAALISDHSAPASYQLANYLQPSLKGLLAAASHFNFDRGQKYPGDESPFEILQTTIADQFAVENALKQLGQKKQTEPFTGSPANQRLYVQEGGWRDFLRTLTLGGARARLYNVPAGQAKAHAEQRESMTRMQRAQDDVKELTDQLVQGAKSAKVGMLLHGNELQPGIHEAVSALTARKINRIEWAKANGKHGALGAADGLAADAHLLRLTGKITPRAERRLVVWATKTARTPAGQDRVRQVLEVIGRIYFHRQVLSLVERILKARGVEVKVPNP